MRSFLMWWPHVCGNSKQRVNLSPLPKVFINYPFDKEWLFGLQHFTTWSWLPDNMMVVLTNAVSCFLWWQVSGIKLNSTIIDNWSLWLLRSHTNHHCKGIIYSNGLDGSVHAWKWWVSTMHSTIARDALAQLRSWQNITVQTIKIVLAYVSSRKRSILDQPVTKTRQRRNKQNALIQGKVSL